jgi:electron transfer flavoprotein alpha/beta subunit
MSPPTLWRLPYNQEELIERLLQRGAELGYLVTDQAPTGPIPEETLKQFVVWLRMSDWDRVVAT